MNATSHYDNNQIATESLLSQGFVDLRRRPYIGDGEYQFANPDGRVASLGPTNTGRTVVQIESSLQAKFLTRASQLSDEALARLAGFSGDYGSPEATDLLEREFTATQS